MKPIVTPDADPALTISLDDLIEALQGAQEKVDDSPGWLNSIPVVVCIDDPMSEPLAIKRVIGDYEEGSEVPFRLRLLVKQNPAPA